MKFSKVIFLAIVMFGVVRSDAQYQFSMSGMNGTLDEVQSGTVTGTIVSRDGKPAASVNISLNGTDINTVSDESGRFILSNLKAGTYQLNASFVGLQTQQKQVIVENGKTTQVQLTMAENAATLETVIVRATKGLNTNPATVGKVAIDPMNLPQSVAVVPGKLISDQQAQRLSDVIRNVNGIYLANTRAGTQENFGARGYFLTSSNLFKNGSRINTGAMPEMSSLEKVEILKGSAAILYGNVAPGGIVNMITKKPKFYFGGEISMRAGSYDLYKPSFDVYGPISNNIAYRVNGTFETANSYRDVVKNKRYYVNPSFLINLGKKTELLLQGDYLQHEFTPDFGIGTLNNTIIPDVPRSRFMGAEWQYAETRQATASANIKHQLNNKWKLVFNSSYQNYNRDYYSVERILADANGKWLRPLGRQDINEDYFIGQLDLTGDFSTGKINHTFLAGVDADRYYTTSYSFNQPATYDTFNILNPGRYIARTDIPVAERIRVVNTPVNRFGAYIQDLVSLSEKVKVMAGLRWSQQTALPAITTDLLTKAETLGTSKTDKAFSPRVGIVYRPVATTSLFASYSNSFTVNSGTDVNGNALDPSIIDQYEAGVKNDFFKGAFSANLTVYRITNNNLAQTSPFAADGVTPNNNTNIKILAGESTSDGVELDLASHPVKGLDIFAGYSYNYIRYTKTPDATGNFVEGERLVEVPLQTANGSLFYTFANPKLKGLKLGTTVFYTGNRFGGYNNRKGQSQNFNRMIEVDGYTTVDVMANYSLKHVALQAKVSNLTNAFSYNVHDNYSINPIAPRQFIATVGYRF